MKYNLPVLIPNLRAVRITRHAISPLLDIKILSNSGFNGVDATDLEATGIRHRRGNSVSIRDIV